MTPIPKRCPRCGDILREPCPVVPFHNPMDGRDDHDDGSVAGTVWACIGMVVVWALVGWWWFSV